jgi:hypothetical protein
MAPAIVNNRICFVRFPRSGREVNVSFVVRVMFLGTKIVVYVHVAHPERQEYGTLNKLVLSC